MEGGEYMEGIKQPRNIMTSGNDPYDHTLKGKLNGLFYYYWEPALGDNNAQILTGTTDAISNITYVPFFDIKDADLLSIPFDNKRYGGASGYRVYRIISPRLQEEVDLLTLPLYNIELPRLGMTRDFKYESKLQDYPYRTIMFTSNAFESYEVKPHLVDRGSNYDNSVTLKSYTPVSANGSFYVYANGYRQPMTIEQTLERQYINSSMDIPNTSSAYSNYMSTQKAQTAVRLDATLLNAKLKPWQGLASGLVNGSGILGKITGAGTGYLGGAFQGAIDRRNAINENLAMKQDLASTPNSLKSAGGDLLTRLGKSSQTFVSGGFMHIDGEYRKMIGDYFHMYGYKQSRLMDINLRSRYFFNYVKTIGANVQVKRGERTKIPTLYMEEIKSIFDNGVTLWHVDRKEYKVGIGNYGMENVEMSIVEGRL